MRKAVTFVGWGFCVLHVVGVRWLALSRRPRERGFDSSLVFVASVLTVTIVLAACLFGGSTAQCSPYMNESFTISNIVQNSPWCAAFAVAASIGSAGVRRALLSVGNESVDLVIATVAFAAFPSVGILTFVHGVLLVAMGACAVRIAYDADFHKSFGPGAITLHRVHVAGAATCGTISFLLSFYVTDPRIQLWTNWTETAAFMHIASAFV